MRRVFALVLIVVLPGCSWFRNLDHGDAKANAVQALVTTTRSAVLLMTAAGLAYDAGAFGAPGTPRAEDTWGKIAAESVRMSEALSAWSEAIRVGGETSAFATMVGTALAVIQALLPTRNVGLHMPAGTVAEWRAKLACPSSSFRMQPAMAGGAR